MARAGWSACRSADVAYSAEYALAAAIARDGDHRQPLGQLLLHHLEAALLGIDEGWVERRDQAHEAVELRAAPVVHRHHDPGIDVLHHVGHEGHAHGEGAVDRHHQHVDAA